MDTLPIAVGVGLVAIAAVFVLLPLARGSHQIEPTPTTDPEAADRFQLYRQVLELEFDYQVGKLSAEDFHMQSTELLGQAGRLLRDERGTQAELDDEIEREIAAARAAFAAVKHSARTAGAPR